MTHPEDRGACDHEDPACCHGCAAAQDDLGPYIMPGAGGRGEYMARHHDIRPGRVAWVIQGGESGSKARPFDLAWAWSLRDQCRAAGVPYFLKQLGARPFDSAIPIGHGRGLALRDSHGGDESEWPEDLRGCRAFPEAQ